MYIAKYYRMRCSCWEETWPTSVYEQGVVVDIVLLDELSQLVGLRGVVELVQVLNLVSRPGKC